MATLPADYTQTADGFWYYTDGTGPYGIDGAGNPYLIGGGGGLPVGGGGASPNSARALVENLGQPTIARQLAAGAASANTVLTVGCLRCSIVARNADIRFSVGSSAQTANAATSHWISAGERLDIKLPATPNIAVIRAAGIDGILELTELT